MDMKFSGVTISLFAAAALTLAVAKEQPNAVVSSAGEETTPLRPATLTWGGVSNNDQFSTPEAQTGWEFTAQHMDAMFLHGAYWMNQSGPEWESNCSGLGKVLMKHGKKAHVETGFGESRGFDPTKPEKRQPYQTAKANAARIRELKKRFGIDIVKVRADWFPMFAMAAYAQHYQLRDDNLKFLAVVTGADDVFGPYPQGFTAEMGNWREYVTTLDRELPGIAIAFDQAPCNHRPVDVPEVRVKVPWPGLGYGYTRKVSMLNQPPVLVAGKPVEVKFDFADQFMGTLVASRSAKVNFIGFEGDTPFNYLTDGPKDFPQDKLIAYLLAIERMVHAQGKKNGRIINDCGKAYGDADNGWVRIDLGSAQEVDHIRIAWGNDLPADGSLKTSLDDKEYIGWGKTVKPDKPGASVDYRQKRPRQARYVRWEPRKRATPRGYQVRSIEVYGPAAPEADLARGKFASASSVSDRELDQAGKPLHQARLITDGDPATYWEGNFIDNDAWDRLYHDRTLQYLEFYQAAGGRADEYIAESWYSGPFTFFPEMKPGTYSNLARDLIRRIKGVADDGSLMPLDLSVRPTGEAWVGEGLRQSRPAGVQIKTIHAGICELRIRNDARETNKGDARATPLLRAVIANPAGWAVTATTAKGVDITDSLFARKGADGWFVGGLEPGQERILMLAFRAPAAAGRSSDKPSVTFDLYWNPQETVPSVRDAVTFILVSP